MFRSTLVAFILTCALMSAVMVQAQNMPDADLADVSSIDAIVAALYDVISGPIGEVRDRDRFMSLFVEGARLIPVGPDPETGETGVRMLSPGDYWTNNADVLQQIGFTETEIGRTTETFGGVTHAFSAYASYRSDRGNSESPFSRGVNSIQLLNDGERWWIVSVYWDSERPGTEIPPQYITR